MSKIYNELVDVSGIPRILKLYDGFYVVGNGMFVPVNSREEGIEIIKKEIEDEKNEREKLEKKKKEKRKGKSK